MPERRRCFGRSTNLVRLDGQFRLARPEKNFTTQSNPTGERRKDKRIIHGLTNQQLVNLFTSKCRYILSLPAYFPHASRQPPTECLKPVKPFTATCRHILILTLLLEEAYKESRQKWLAVKLVQTNLLVLRRNFTSSLLCLTRLCLYGRIYLFVCTTDCIRSPAQSNCMLTLIAIRCQRSVSRDRMMCVQ